MLNKDICKHCCNDRSDIEMRYEECEAVWQQDYIYNPEIPARTKWRCWCDVDEEEWNKDRVNCRIINPLNYFPYSTNKLNPPPFWCPYQIEHIISS